jgi:hypothetical protein
VKIKRNLSEAQLMLSPWITLLWRPRMRNEAHIKAELSFPAAAIYGSNNRAVRRVQEWLTLRGFGTEIDSKFGPATLTVVKRFQTKQGREPTGVLSPTDWDDLTATLRAALAPPSQLRFLARVRAVAQQHLKQNGHEVGGENAGPWVRTYMKGQDGNDQLWCAGFASLILRQASLACDDTASTIWHGYHEVSCDALAAFGKHHQRFFSHLDARNSIQSGANNLATAIFLRRKSPNDWNHVGIALNPRVESNTVVFDTVEGNADPLGGSNGIEVRENVRAGKDYDFIKLSY